MSEPEIEIKITITTSSGIVYESAKRKGTRDELARVKAIFKDFPRLDYVSLELRPGLEAFFNPRHIASIEIDDGTSEEP